MNPTDPTPAQPLPWEDTWRTTLGEHTLPVDETDFAAFEQLLTSPTALDPTHGTRDRARIAGRARTHRTHYAIFILVVAAIALALFALVRFLLGPQSGSEEYGQAKGPLQILNDTFYLTNGGMIVFPNSPDSPTQQTVLIDAITSDSDRTGRRSATDQYAYFPPGDTAILWSAHGEAREVIGYRYDTIYELDARGNLDRDRIYAIDSVAIYSNPKPRR